MDFETEVLVRLKEAKTRSTSAQVLLEDPELFGKIDKFSAQTGAPKEDIETAVLLDNAFGIVVRSALAKDVTKMNIPERVFLDRLVKRHKVELVHHVITTDGRIKSSKDDTEVGDSQMSTCFLPELNTVVWFRNTTGDGGSQKRTLQAVHTIIENARKNNKVKSVVVLSGDYWKAHKTLLPETNDRVAVLSADAI